MKWTDQQENAIKTRGSDILVSAAAGSGKTAVLTERIKQLIINEGISAENMLIVTFSNAAASEMKEKIIKALSAEAEAVPEKAQMLRSQIRKARIADISTFHKFSMGIIRRYFYLTDVEASFSICDEGRREILIEETLDELIESRFSEASEFHVSDSEREQGEASAEAAAAEVTEEHSMTFTDFLKRYSGVRSEDDVRNMITDVYRFISSMPDSIDWLYSAVEDICKSDAEMKDLPVFRFMNSEMCRIAESAVKYSEEAASLISGIESLEPKAEQDCNLVKLIADAAQTGDYDSLAESCDVKFSQFRVKKAEQESYNDVKASVDIMRKKMKAAVEELKYMSAAVSPQSAGRIRATYPSALYLADLVRDFHERFSAKKREKNVLDFNDIEHKALEILRNEDIAEEYRKHFEVIFIDEYQDSSILQETLIQRISRGNNVYMVGDVKQSIYKFRLAEPEIFINKYNDFRDGVREGQRIDLNRNFRSKGNIIKAVNAVFRNIMNRETCGIDYDDDAALKKGSSYEGELDRPVSLHLIDTSLPENMSEIDEEIAELRSVEIEAHKVAQLVQSRIGTEIYDSKRECIRKVEPEDIVILMRGTRSQGDIYVKILREYGMAALVDSGDGYFETTEIEVFINLLKVIDNRNNDVPLLSVLYSAVFGFTLDELLQIRLAGGRMSYSRALLKCVLEDISETGISQELKFKCENVYKKLDEWRRYARYMPLEDFLWYLMQNTGYLDYVSALPNGRRRAANLRSLADRAADFSASQKNRGLFSFLRYIEAVSSSNARTGQVIQPDAGGNTIRIMTIHKSKGLEFPVVITTGLGRKFNADRNTKKVILHKDLGIALQYSDPDRHCYSETSSHKMISLQKKRERMAEEMRILYVAMTRAMDELILVGSMKNLEAELEKYDAGTRGADIESAANFLDWIIPYAAEGDIERYIYKRKDFYDAKNAQTESIDALQKDIEEGFSDYRDKEGYLGMLEQRFSYTYPHKADVESKSKFSVSELNRILKGERLEIIRTISGSAEEIDSKAAMPYQEDTEDSAAVEESAENQAAAVSECSSYQNTDTKRKKRRTEHAVPSFIKGETEITPAQRGTLTHKVMELIPFRENMTSDEIKEFIKSLIPLGHMTEREAAAVDCERIAGFFRSDIGKRACRAQWLRKEWAFTLKKSRAEIKAMAGSSEIAENIDNILADEVIIQGIIDCCFRDENGIVIVDYKTDRVKKSDIEGSKLRFAEEYRNQLALYSDVIEKALDEPVAEKLLFLLDSGDILRI